jgi:hypothetical protein
MAVRIKPFPKLLLILSVVGAIGYGINFYLEKHPRPAAQAQPETAQAFQPPEAAEMSSAPAVQVQAPAPQPAPQATAPQEQATQQDDSQNAGLSNLLKAGQK